MDGKTYDDLRKRILDRIEFDAEIGRDMLTFATELVVYLNNSLEKNWRAFELGRDLNDNFSREIPQVVDRSTLPFSVAITFANKNGETGRSYGQEHQVSVPFVIEWRNHYFEVRCSAIDEVAVTFAKYEIREKRVLDEVSAIFDKAVAYEIEKFIASR